MNPFEMKNGKSVNNRTKNVFAQIRLHDNSSTLYDVTFTICVTSHNDPIYGIKHYMFMLYSLDMASGTVL